MKPVSILLALVLSGCGALPWTSKPEQSGELEAGSEPVGTEVATEPDVESDAEAASAPDTQAATAAGLADALASGPKTTIAGLGDPTRPGMWIETPLVSVERSGQVRATAGGPTIPVSLVPAEGDASSGSRLSLEAMQALGAPLTELVEVEVRSSG